MEKFLGVIIILILAMILARLLFRHLFPWLLHRYVERRMKDFNSNFQNMDREKQSSEGKTYGDIRVDNIPQDGKQQRKDYVDEEYVDFEELNEER